MKVFKKNRPHRGADPWSSVLRCLILSTPVQWPCTGVRVGPQRRLSTKELMFLNTVVLEKTLDHHLGRGKIKPVNPKGNQS